MSIDNRPRQNGISIDQFLSLCDDTRHLVSSVRVRGVGTEVPTSVPSPRFINIDTAPDLITNQAEIDAVLADLGDLFAESDEHSADEAESEVVPQGVVQAHYAPDVGVPGESDSTTIDLGEGVAGCRQRRGDKFAFNASYNPIAPKNGIGMPFQRGEMIEHCRGQDGSHVAENESDARLIDFARLMPCLAPVSRYAEPAKMIETQYDRSELIRRRFEDIVYAHAQGHRAQLDTSLGDGKFRRMMSGDSLDHDLVREFVEIVSSPDHKTGRMTDEHLAESILFLPKVLQLRLAQLCSNAIKSKRRNLAYKRSVTEAKLRQSLQDSGDPNLSGHVKTWVTLWELDQLVICVRGPSSYQEVADLYHATTGNSMNRSDVRKKLAVVDRRLGKAKKPS